MLAEESGRLKLRKNSWILNLCFIKCLCKRSRGMRLQEKAIEQFEDSLDIRSIVKTRIDLSILLRSLLSKEQLVLFRNQHARAFTAHNLASQKMDPEPVGEQDDGLLGLDFIEMTEDPASFSMTFDRIKGYSIQTDLDRKLLLGVWKHEPETKMAPL